MSNHAHRHRRSRRDPLQSYAQALAATGMDEREVARAFFYAQHYGLDALSGDGCVTFDIPSCLDWDCLNPTHQTIEKS